MNRICLFLLMGVLVTPHLILASSSTADENARNGDRAGALIKRFDQNVIVQTIKSLIDLTGSSFKSGFEASVRSIFNKPLTTAVYAISMLIGAVAMLSFYESPISPIPVPPLPDPPVGRFPPEHSVWPPAGEGQPIGFIGQNKRNSAVYQGAASILNPQFVLSPQQSAHLGQSQQQQVQQAQQGFYPIYGYNNEHHRSDKMPAAASTASASAVSQTSGSQNTRPNSKSSEKAQEAAYNEYISKLTSQLNQQQQALAAQADQTQPQYDPSMYQNIDQTNKVIDYSNKRMSVENMKFQGLNNSTQSANSS